MVRNRVTFHRFWEWERERFPLPGAIIGIVYFLLYFYSLKMKWGNLKLNNKNNNNNNNNNYYYYYNIKKKFLRIEWRIELISRIGGNSKLYLIRIRYVRIGNLPTLEELNINKKSKINLAFKCISHSSSNSFMHKEITSTNSHWNISTFLHNWVSTNKRNSSFMISTMKNKCETKPRSVCVFGIINVKALCSSNWFWMKVIVHCDRVVEVVGATINRSCLGSRSYGRSRSHLVSRKKSSSVLPKKISHFLWGNTDCISLLSFVSIIKEHCSLQLRFIWRQHS